MAATILRFPLMGNGVDWNVTSFPTVNRMRRKHCLNTFFSLRGKSDPARADMLSVVPSGLIKWC